MKLHASLNIISLFVPLCLLLPEIYAQKCDSVFSLQIVNFHGEMSSKSSQRGISKLFLPEFINESKCLRSFVRDQRFQALRTKEGELRTVDILFQKALALSDYNISRALALCLLTVLEHKELKIDLPLIPPFSLPLKFESDSIFNARVHHLPTQLYPDSPKSPDGDRDKLQHFFAAAYLTYATETESIPLLGGNAIEWFEKNFVVEGSNDWRDKAVNKQGILFAQALFSEPLALPSEFMSLPLKR
jgi:hypothetical protein